jgi:hypothetical protein
MVRQRKLRRDKKVADFVEKINAIKQDFGAFYDR